MSDIKTIAGWVAGIFSFAAYMPYWWAIFKTRNLPESKRMRPNRATWIVWGFISLILVASYYSAGARSTILVPVVYAVCSNMTLVFSLKYGEGGWTPFDRRCLAVATGSALLWWITGSPLIAILANLGVDLAGAVPTFRKTFVDPSSEDRTAWLLFFAGSIANIFAVKEWSFAIGIYPIYMLLVIGVIVMLTLREKPA